MKLWLLSPLTLEVYLDSKQEAHGMIYLDDGESIINEEKVVIYF
jgi:hypothetical protein